MKFLYIFVLYNMLVKSLGQVGRMQIIEIGKPELSCGEDGEIIQMISETTKLRLQAYSQAFFSVNWERALTCTNPQTCLLMNLKIIRNLEMYLNSHFTNTGSTGIVEFKNDMVIPGFNYLLHVTLKNPFGEIEQNDYNLTYFNGADKFSTIDILGKLDLNVRSMNRYQSLPIFINANVTVCGNIQYYYFKWFLVKDNDEIKLPWKSAELSILPSLVLDENEIIVVIKCQVVNFENDMVIMEDWKSFNLVDAPDVVDEVKVVLPFKYTTLNKDAPISIVPYIYVSKGLDYKLEWSCIFENTLIFVCQKQTSDQFFMEMGFNEEGNYSITLTVTSGNIKKAATCNVLILPDVPSIEFNLAYPIKPEEGIEISAKIFELRTYCTVQWFEDQDNQSSLQGIPGLTTTIYNISAADKSFLAEMVEFGRVTVTRDFKFKIPPPSRTWPGLATKNYQIKLVVTCPALKEIYDKNVVKEMPDEFVTISGETEFFVPPSPTVKLLDVLSEDHMALSSEYYYVVQPVDDTLMVYKFGFILEDIEVVFFSGNDIFGASTILPYNEDYGIETFVEVCNYENRCGKKFGPVIKPTINYDLDDKKISKTFKQKLIEENFYAAFSYAFIILHSAKFVNQNQKFSNIFSSELSLKLKKMLGENSTKFVDNNFMNSLVTFIDHLQFSDELMLQLSQITHEFLINAQYRKRIPRQVSESFVPAPDDLENLEEIKNYMITSEYIILNSDDSDAVAKEKSHMISLLDRWMDRACKIIFKGQRIQNVEMKTAIFTIEKMSEKTLNTFMIVPFDFNSWNVTTHMKINNVAYSNSLCIGNIMLKSIFDKNDITFGTKIFSGDKERAEILFPVQITIFLPKTQEALQLECFVHENDLDHQCSAKELDNFVECACPTYGYYFLVYGNNTFQNSTEKSNKTSDEYNIYLEHARRLGEKISYAIIISSLVGFLILCYIIRKLTIYPQQNFAVDGFSDSYQYGNILHEDFLS